eukprot:7795287-Pyramimonas_sp.AAC.2
MYRLLNAYNKSVDPLEHLRGDAVTELNRCNDLKSSNFIGKQNPKSKGPTPRCAGPPHCDGVASIT